MILAKPNEPIVDVADPAQFGPLDEDGIPLEIEGYSRLPRLQTVAIIDQLGAIAFGDGEDIVRIRNLDSAATTEQRYVYDPESDVMIDAATGLFMNPFAVPGRPPMARRSPADSRLELVCKTLFASSRVQRLPVLCCLSPFGISFFLL